MDFSLGLLVTFEICDACDSHCWKPSGSCEKRRQSALGKLFHAMYSPKSFKLSFKYSIQGIPSFVQSVNTFGSFTTGSGNHYLMAWMGGMTSHKMTAVMAAASHKKLMTHIRFLGLS